MLTDRLLPALPETVTCPAYINRCVYRIFFSRKKPVEARAAFKEDGGGIRELSYDTKRFFYRCIQISSK